MTGYGKFADTFAADGKGFTYTNDLLGRRTSKNDEQYSYNVRDELIAADEVSYAYDDIGNRTTAEGKTYTANNLNQYTAIDDFAPQYDADGNQTLIMTETGVWLATYNAENRPVRWEFGDTVITMAFDRMGRRVEMRTQSADSDLLQRFVYDNYLCIQQLRGTDNTPYQSYVWDPTEPIATRPLIFIPSSGALSYYFHNGNKDVSNLVDIQERAVHYDYTSFGRPMEFALSENPFSFSSEFYDRLLGLTYYNYRHYSPTEGKWMVRDLLGEMESINLFCFLKNKSSYTTDALGQFSFPSYEDIKSCVREKKKDVEDVFRALQVLYDGYMQMRRANTINADKWFHCVAMCEAARYARKTTISVSYLREITDTIKYCVSNPREAFDKDTVLSDEFWNYIDQCFEDLEANGVGIGCPQEKTCKECCCRFLPNGLDETEWMNGD